MKLHTDRNEIERSNVSAESAFRIKTTAKAFDILSSGLYTDRVQAVVRELSCNAIDAHVAANNSNPFEIHLPNQFEPWFHVRDNGTGLSDEDVMNLYSTYFDSTKTNSNDYIGALGLGSKSPFSYTKAFEVISRFEHVRRTYSVFINEDGVPTIAKMGEFVTDEHNGLEVRVTVKKEDFWTFYEKVRYALRWFPVKPTIVGVERFDWLPMPKESLSGKGWMMFDSDFTNDYSKMTAVQGNVAYRVDISKLGLGTTDSDLLQNCHIVGFFNIGELEVAASREEIRYDDRSKAALIQRIKDVRVGILKSVESRVNGFEADGMNFWNITIQLNKMADEMFGNRSQFNQLIRTSKNDSIRAFIELGGNLRIPELHGHEISGYDLSRNVTDPSKAPFKRRTVSNGIRPETNIVVFLNDMKTGGVSKIIHYLRMQNPSPGSGSNSPSTAIVIRRLEKPNLREAPEKGELVGKQIEWTAEQFEDEYDTLIEFLGHVEVKLASTDAPVPPRSPNNYYKSLPIFQFEKANVRRYGKSTIVWARVQPDNLDLNKDSLYFFIRNGAHITVIDKDGFEKDLSWDVANIENYLQASVKLINEAQGTKYTMKNVFAVGSMAAKKIKKLPNWVNLFDVLKTLMSQYRSPMEYFRRLPQTSDVMGIRDSIVQDRGSKRDRFIRDIEQLNKKSKFRETLIPLIEDTIAYEKHATACHFLQRLDVDLGTKIYDNLSSKGYYGKNAFEDYPMLSFVQQYNHLDRKQSDLFFDYIATIDRS